MNFKKPFMIIFVFFHEKHFIFNLICYFTPFHQNNSETTTINSFLTMNYFKEFYFFSLNHFLLFYIKYRAKKLASVFHSTIVKAFFYFLGNFSAGFSSCIVSLSWKYEKEFQFIILKSSRKFIFKIKLHTKNN